MKLRLLFTAATALLMAGFAHAAQAQVAPYAMFSASHYSGLGVGIGTAPNQSGGITPMGGTFGAYVEELRGGPVTFGADFRGIIENSANSTQYGNKLSGVLVGGRIAANTMVLPFRPYGQFEIGAIGTNNGTQTSRTVGFAYQFQFGGDFTLVPHLALRVEYGAGQVSMAGQSNKHTLQTFGTGLVFRL